MNSFFIDMQVNAHEYDSLGVTTKKGNKISAKNTKTYKINRFRLALAIAKCTFTRNPDWKYGFSESIINILRVETLLQAACGSGLLLNKDRVELIRDFSKTTRIGELAQGVSFLFAQDVLGIPTPYDFVGYLEKYYKKAPKGSTPDFIGCSSNNSYDLIESKGSLAGDEIVKSRLTQALNQCDEGEKTLNAVGQPNAMRKFGVLTLFELDNDSTTNNSSIHYCDPADESQRSFDSWQLIVAYYEAILKGFTGIESIEALKLLKSEEHTYKNHSFKMIKLDLSESRLNFPPYFITYPIFGEFGISTKVLEQISSKSNNEADYFKTIQQLIDISYDEDETDKTKISYEIFTDGTIFKINR